MISSSIAGDPAGTRTPDLRLKRALLYQLSYWVIYGWDGWTRTSECGSQSPVPYHLATPQYERCGTGRSGRSGPQPLYGVGNGARTHDTRNHNPVLCQLSYTHHMQFEDNLRWPGTPEGTRTPGPLLRRQLLYPPELQAHIMRFTGSPQSRPTALWGKEGQRNGGSRQSRKRGL